MLAGVEHDFVVAEMPNGRSDEPLLLPPLRPDMPRAAAPQRLIPIELPTVPVRTFIAIASLVGLAILLCIWWLARQGHAPKS